jgi:7-carboxy-7-deazaguanine synthase (Cx14CxxC type)
MPYKVKEVFYTLQGEGARSGRPAVFCRFSGCNLWSGREKDRFQSICRFCDTDFLGTNGQNGGTYQTPGELAKQIRSLWPERGNLLSGSPYVVLTGGEPALQVDSLLIQELHALGFEIAIETNGTCELPYGIDWVCVSPKSQTKLKTQRGNELKIVFPQADLHPTDYENLTFDHFFLQPLDDAHYKDNLKATIKYCLQNPKWRLGLQIHKYIGVK